MRPSAVSPRRNTNQTAPKAKIASPVPRLASNGDGAGSTFRSSGVFRAICTRLFAVMAQCEMRQPPRCSRRRGAQRQARPCSHAQGCILRCTTAGPRRISLRDPNAPPTSPASSVTPAWSRHPAQRAFSSVGLWLDEVNRRPSRFKGGCVRREPFCQPPGSAHHHHPVTELTCPRSTHDTCAA